MEIQSQRRRNFAERMYIYNYRIYDRFRQRVASLAVLADRSPTWRPNQFGYTIWDSQVDYRYAVVKLNDYRARWLELEASENPFATVVMAHLWTQDTRNDSLARHDAKLSLIKRLYRLSAARSPGEQAEVREQVRKLLRFIDRVMRLPPKLDQQLWQELKS